MDRKQFFPGEIGGGPIPKFKGGNGFSPENASAYIEELRIACRAALNIMGDTILSKEAWQWKN